MESTCRKYAISSWLDSLRLHDESIKTDCDSSMLPVTLPSSEFLEDISPPDRRSILANHHRVIMNEKWKVNEAEKSVKKRPMLVIPSDVRIVSRGVIEIPDAINTTEESNHEGEMLLRYTAKGEKNDRKRDREDEKHSDDPSTLSSSSMATMGHPYLQTIRRSIYEKYILHFQMLYNEHEAIAMSTLLLHPCCDSEMEKSTTLYATVPRLTKVKTVTFQGRNDFYSDFAHKFKQMPDCVLLYHEVKVFQCDFLPLHSNGKKGTIVRSSYSFFFTIAGKNHWPRIPVPASGRASELPLPQVPLSKGQLDEKEMENKNSGSSSPSITGKSTPAASPSVDRPLPSPKGVSVHVGGVNLLYFDERDVVIRNESHICLKSVSDPSVTVSDIMKVYS